VSATPAIITMFLQLTLPLTAMVVNAMVVPPNNISTSATIQSLHKRTRIDNAENVRMPYTDEDLGVYTNTYTTQQTEQYYQGHLDVLKMCKEVVAESECDTDLFQRLFAEYFDPKDRETVVGASPFHCKHSLVSTRWLIIRSCVQSHGRHRRRRQGLPIVRGHRRRR
jgi:hypothetical protein